MSDKLQRKQKRGGRLNWFTTALIIVGLGVAGGAAYHYYSKQDANNYAALDSKDDKRREVHIKEGATTGQMAVAMDEAGVLRSQRAFTHYVTAHNFTDLKAGYYQLSPDMPVDQLVLALRLGGSSVSQNNKNMIVVREGEGIDAIADEVGEKTDFSAESFRKATNDPELFKKLQTRYPGMLDSAAKAKDVRYRLEGYLYPATYSWRDADTVEELVTMMVRQEFFVIQPRLETIKKTGLTVHEVITLASLVEREGVDKESRRIIAGIFLNRIDEKMPFQSDVATKYALRTKRTNLTNEDVQSDNPYNLYKFAGFGPGPFNNPSKEAIDAVLNPKDRDKGYLFFVANLETGENHYSRTFDSHLTNQGNVNDTNMRIGDAADKKRGAQ